MGIPYSVLMPVFANEVLGGGPRTLGVLLTAGGCGALLAALTLAARRSVRGLGRVIPMAAGLFGISLVAFSYSTNLWLSMAILVMTGYGIILQMASSNTLLQTIADDEKRGRVMSFYTMAYLGAAPLGSLLAGTLSMRIGAPNTVRLGGLCVIAGALWFARGLPQLREAIRPIYVRMGIIPEMAEGLQSATQLTTPPED
jgi:MFS family permease